MVTSDTFFWDGESILVSAEILFAFGFVDAVKAAMSETTFYSAFVEYYCVLHIVAIAT
jgi:hypothetical protein